MRRRKATYEEGINFLRESMMMGIYPSKEQLQAILDEHFPFSWARYCEKNKIQEKIIGVEAVRKKKVNRK